jgi:hypothetical protein
MERRVSAHAEMIADDEGAASFLGDAPFPSSAASTLARDLSLDAPRQPGEGIGKFRDGAARGPGRL